MKVHRLPNPDKPEISNFFHRRDAKDAEMFFFFFAVDPPKIPADRKDGKE